MPLIATCSWELLIFEISNVCGLPRTTTTIDPKKGAKAHILYNVFTMTTVKTTISSKYPSPNVP
jgi:hypothetical protein